MSARNTASRKVTRSAGVLHTLPSASLSFRHVFEICEDKKSRSIFNMLFFGKFVKMKSIMSVWLALLKRTLSI